MNACVNEKVKEMNEFPRRVYFYAHATPGIRSQQMTVPSEVFVVFDQVVLLLVFCVDMYSC